MTLGITEPEGRRERLARLLAVAGAERRVAPLSFAQERMWFLHRVEPQSPAYNLPVALRFSGDLDRAALERALSEIVRRHAVLRTTYHDVDGIPLQIVAKSQELPLKSIDLRGTGERGEPVPLAEILAAEALRPFDLGRGPLLRAKLLQTGDAEHFLVATVHHIAADGWSGRVFLGELAAGYGAFAQGGSSPLPELGASYLDYAAWQRRQLDGERLDALIAYWAGRLDGLRLPPPLPTDRSRWTGRGWRGGCVAGRLSADTTRRLREVSRRGGATLFMTLLLAFLAVLRQRTGQDDVVVGTDVANRDLPEMEKLIGFFVNQLVLRVDLRGDFAVADALARVREVCLEGYAHQDLPYERLVRALGRSPSAQRWPLFRVRFNLQDRPFGTLRLPGLEITPTEPLIHLPRAELQVDCHDRGSHVETEFLYDADLFDASTVEGWRDDFELAAAAVADGTARSVEQLSEALRGPRGQADGGACVVGAASAGSPRRHVAPRDAVELELIRIWEECLGVSPIGVNDDFFALGGHSLLALRLLARVKARFDRELPVATLFSGPTVEAQAGWLRRVGPAAPSVLVPLVREGTLPPVVAVHPSGGHVACYVHLARRVAANRPFWALQAHGLHANEQPDEEVPAMAARYLAALSRLGEDSSRFIGYSSGGLIAFEMASQLRAAGRDVGPVLLIDAAPPTLAGEELSAAAAASWRSLVAMVEAFYGLPPLLPDDARELDEEAGLRVWIECARARGVLPPDLGIDDVGRILAVFRANERALGRHRATPQDLEVVLFSASDGAGAAVAAASAARGWAAATRGHVELVDVPGDHVTLLLPPHVDRLAALLRERLTPGA
jgi:thioesterase domain-containing protein